MSQAFLNSTLPYRHLALDTLASDTLGYAIKRNPGQPLQALNLTARLTVPLTWNEEDKPELIRAPPHCATQVPCGKEREINHFRRTKKGGAGEDEGEKVTCTAILRRALCMC
jgi:hypothetical protein